MLFQPAREKPKPSAVLGGQTKLAPMVDGKSCVGGGGCKSVCVRVFVERGWT